jgi:hypothetical protein
MDYVPEQSERESGSAAEQRIAEQLLEQARLDGVRLVGPGGLLAGVTRRILESALEAEMSQHLAYDKGDPAGRGAGNGRAICQARARLRWEWRHGTSITPRGRPVAWVANCIEHYLSRRPARPLGIGH